MSLAGGHLMHFFSELVCEFVWGISAASFLCIWHWMSLSYELLHSKASVLFHWYGTVENPHTPILSCLFCWDIDFKYYTPLIEFVFTWQAYKAWVGNMPLSHDLNWNTEYKGCKSDFCTSETHYYFSLAVISHSQMHLSCGKQVELIALTLRYCTWQLVGTATGNSANFNGINYPFAFLWWYKNLGHKCHKKYGHHNK